MRKLVAYAVLAVSLAAPASVSAKGGPDSLGFCDIAEWLGVDWVKECED